MPVKKLRALGRCLLGLALAVGAAALVRAQPGPAQPVSTPSTADWPIFDAHLHYSHDAWERLPPAQAVALMRQAGLKRAMVSSSSDEGTQKLYAAAPDLVLPVLRPYRSRGEIGTWLQDSSVIAHLEARLQRHRYVALGEYHVYGADADLPVMRRVVQLAREHGLFLHSHSDADAIDRQFQQDPKARILWAHAGFDTPDKVREMLRKHPNLWCDLAFRSDHASGAKIDPAWRALFLEFPDRFLLGTDTFTPERWYYVGEHAKSARAWLADLPQGVAQRIAWQNGEALFTRMLQPPPCVLAAGDGAVLSAQGVQLAWRTEPATLAVGQPFAVILKTCASGVQPLRVDALMPEHRHGMNYRPSLQALPGGRWRAEGLLWHMSGHWQLRVEVQNADQRQWLSQRVDLP